MELEWKSGLIIRETGDGCRKTEDGRRVSGAKRIKMVVGLSAHAFNLLSNTAKELWITALFTLSFLFNKYAPFFASKDPNRKNWG